MWPTSDSLRFWPVRRRRGVLQKGPQFLRIAERNLRSVRDYLHYAFDPCWIVRHTAVDAHYKIFGAFHFIPADVLLLYAIEPAN
jgi:hypothetical protein